MCRVVDGLARAKCVDLLTDSLEQSELSCCKIGKVVNR